MKSIKLALIYGVLVWLIPFAVAFAIFPIHESNRPLFESIMPVALTLSVVFFLILYFKRVDKNFLQEGIRLGVLWLIISLIIDAFMFSGGPMKMTPAEYLSDIGVTYIMIPVVTVGAGFLLERKKVKK